jgi:hypothetical protein
LSNDQATGLKQEQDQGEGTGQMDEEHVTMIQEMTQKTQFT